MKQNIFNFQFITDRLRNRGDSEHEQVMVKCLLGVVWLAYIAWVDKHHTVAPEVITASIYFIVVSLIFFIWIIINPEVHPRRRLFGIQMPILLHVSCCRQVNSVRHSLAYIYL